MSASVWSGDLKLILFVAEIRLMEANYMVDEIVGTATFNLADLTRNSWEKKTFVFNDVSRILPQNLSNNKSNNKWYSCPENLVLRKGIFA